MWRCVCVGGRGHSTCLLSQRCSHCEIGDDLVAQDCRLGRNIASHKQAGFLQNMFVKENGKEWWLNFNGSNHCQFFGSCLTHRAVSTSRISLRPVYFKHRVFSLNYSLAYLNYSAPGTTEKGTPGNLLASSLPSSHRTSGKAFVLRAH